MEEIPVKKELTEEEKISLLRNFEREGGESGASEEKLKEIRPVIDELCEKDVEEALRLKGYACYGGSRLYPCDWEMARQIFEKLCSISDDPCYANTLGYIYYYGRTTKGVPDYEKALRCFYFGALQGHPESIYKLGDMYFNGYGVKKRPELARTLYQRIYDQTKKQFPEWPDVNFADAALRMARIYDTCYHLQEISYQYYLEADYAARKRAAASDFFGNQEVAKTAAMARAEAREKLAKDFFVPSILMDDLDGLETLFWDMMDDRYPLMITVHRKKKRISLSISRLDPDFGKIVPYLYTEPRFDYCSLVKAVTLHQFHGKISGKKDTLIFDRFEWDFDKYRLNFYWHNKKAGWLSLRSGQFDCPKKKEKEGGPLRHLARITFQPGGKLYDYLCEIEDIKAGDTVIVMGYDGETPVTVVKTFDCHESELPIAIERYKKVIRKVSD